MAFPIQISKITMGLSTIYFKFTSRNKNNCTSVPKIVFILTNSARPEEIPRIVAFHLDLYCLPGISRFQRANKRMQHRFYDTMIPS